MIYHDENAKKNDCRAWLLWKNLSLVQMMSDISVYRLSVDMMSSSFCFMVMVVMLLIGSFKSKGEFKWWKMTKGVENHSCVLSLRGSGHHYWCLYYVSLYMLIFLKSQRCKGGECLNIRATALWNSSSDNLGTPCEWTKMVYRNGCRIIAQNPCFLGSIRDCQA